MLQIRRLEAEGVSDHATNLPAVVCHYQTPQYSPPARDAVSSLGLCKSLVQSGELVSARDQIRASVCIAAVRLFVKASLLKTLCLNIATAGSKLLASSLLRKAAEKATR